MASSTPCIECGAAPAERSAGGEVLFECGACGAVRVSRGALQRLRERARFEGALVDGWAGPSRGGAPARGLRQKRCPACQGRLLAHAFGGGNVRVESCEACDLVFLGRSQLAAVLREARDGIEMSDDARAFLHQERMLAADRRLSAAEWGLSTGGLVALLLFLRIVVRTGFSTAAAAGAGVIALGIFLHRRRAWQRQRAEAAARMDRLVAGEIHRLDRAGAAPRPHLCPVCKSSLPAGTTHCARCDSDFG